MGAFYRDARPKPVPSTLHATISYRYVDEPIRGPGGISAVVCTDGKRRTVATLLARGKRLFEMAEKERER